MVERPHVDNASIRAVGGDVPPGILLAERRAGERFASEKETLCFRETRTTSLGGDARRSRRSSGS
jgi:hypothetical protein